MVSMSTERRKSLTLGLPESAAAKLTELADRDFRSPSHEAAVLLIAAIERAARAGRPARRSRLPIDADGGGR